MKEHESKHGEEQYELLSMSTAVMFAKEAQKWLKTVKLSHRVSQVVCKGEES